MPADTMRGLRTIMDGRDGFMSGHQILKVRRREKKTPEWVLNDDEVRKLLRKVFPKLDSDLTQRRRAGRWIRVIQLYFRSGKSRQETAEEMGEKNGTIHTLTRSILRAKAGNPINGITRKRATIQTSHREKIKTL